MRRVSPMIQYKKVLVAFDGSENGLKALETAKKITLDNDAQLTVVYVHDKALTHPVTVGKTPAGEDFLLHQYTATGTVSAGRFPDERQTIIVEEEMPHRVMNAAKLKLSSVPHVIYESLVGKPEEEIIDYATAYAMDLIVIGNRGIGALKKLFQGSVSEKVVDHASCSVFIVK